MNSVAQQGVDISARSLAQTSLNRRVLSPLEPSLMKLVSRNLPRTGMRNRIALLVAAMGAFLLPYANSATYWNVFNIEGESSVAADIVTYSSLEGMLTDTNRTGTFTVPGFGRNIVGSGSDGSSYWNVFNIEGESTVPADIVTYSSLGGMLTDTNRTGTFTLSGFGRNIVGSGAAFSRTQSVPDTGPTVVLLGIALWLTLGLKRRFQ
jgi:hypothetical protein